MAERRVNGELITDEEFQPKQNWYARVAVGSVALVGIAAAAKKMGGPTARAIGMTLDQQVDDYAARQQRKWQGLPTNITAVDDFKPIVRTAEGTELDTSNIAKEFDPEETFVNLHGTSNKTSATKRSNAIRDEQKIVDTIRSLDEGKPLYHAINELQIGTHGRDVTGLLKGGVEENYIITATRIETLKQYTATKAQGFANAPEVDSLYDIDLLDNLNAKNVKELEELHHFYMENDANYVEMYSSQVKQMKKNLYMNNAKKVSLANDRYLSLRDNTVLNPQKYGDIQEMFMDAMGPIKMENQSVNLFKSQGAQELSEEAVKKRLGNASANQIFTKNAHMTKSQSQYKGRLNRLANKLNEIKNKHADRIDSVSLDFKNYSTTTSDAAYYEVVIRRKGFGQGTKADIRIPIPIANENNLVPNVTSIEKAKFTNVNYMVGMPGTIDAAKTINSTELMIDKVTYMLDSSMFNDALDASADEIPQQTRKFVSILSDIQRRGNQFVGEERDIFKMHQYRTLFEEEWGGMSARQKQSATDAWSSGIQSIMNMNRLKKLKREAARSGKSSKHKIITIDLETLSLNTVQPSPMFTANERGTGIWQFGMSVSDLDGNIVNMKEVANDHVLREHKLLDLYNSGRLVSELKRGNDAIEKFAQYAQRTVEGAKQGNTIEAKYHALESFIKMVQTKSKMSERNSGVKTNGMNTDVFTDTILKELKKEINKYGKENVTLMFANGREFDMRLMEAISPGNVRNILGNVNVVDVTDIERSLTFGVTDLSGRNVGSILKNYAGKTGMADGTLLDFSKNAEMSLNHLEQQRILKVGRMGGKQFNSLFSAVAGHAGNATQAHSSALVDVVHTQAAAFMMMEHFGDDVFEAASRLNQFIERSNSADMIKMLEDYSQAMGLSLDGNINLFGSGMSNGLLGKKAMSQLDIAHAYGFSSVNPLNRALHQMGRNSWAVKSNTAPRHRYRVNQMSNIIMDVNKMLHVEAGRDANLFANKLNYRTVFTIGSAGMQSGHAGILREIAKDQTFTTFKDLELGAVPTDNPIFSDLKQIQAEVIREAKAMANSNSSDLRKKGEVTNAIFHEAAAKVLAKRDVNKLPTIDPNNPIHKKLIINKSEFQLENNVAGRLSGIKLDGSTSDDQLRLLFSFQFESKDEFLKGGAYNVANHKAVPTIVDADSSTLARYMTRYGLYDTPEFITNVDFIEKNFTGTSKQILVEKAVGFYNHVLNNKGKYDHNSVLQARQGMTKLRRVLDAAIPGGAKFMKTAGGIGVRYGGDMSIHPDQIISAMSGLKYDDLFSALSSMGHEMTWDQEKLKEYYGFFGGGTTENQVRRGRDVLHSVINDELTAAAGSVSEAEAKQIRAMHDSGLQKYIDPVELINQKLRKSKYSKKYGSAMDLLVDGNKTEVDKILNEFKVPIFIQRVPNLNIAHHAQGEDRGILGIFSDFGVTPYAVNTEKTVSYNHNVPLQHNYFDMIMGSDYVTTRDKALMLRSTGLNVDAAKLDSVRTINSFIDTFKANSVSKLMTGGHVLNEAELNLLAGRDETLKQIQKMIEESGSYNAKKYKLINDAISEIKYSAGLVEDIDTANRLELLNMERGKRKFERELEKMTKQHRYISNSQAQKIINLGAEKNGMVFLPLGLTEDNLMKPGEKFKFDVFDMLKRVKNVDAKSLDVDATISMFRKMQEESSLIQGLSNKDLLFNIVTDDVITEKGRIVGGKFEIEMGGLIMPVNQNIKNVFNKLDQEKSLGTAVRGFQYMQDTAMAYQIYRNAIKNGDVESRHLNDAAVFNWMRMMTGAFQMSKDSMLFNAKQVSEPLGINVKFQISDLLQQKARNALEVYSSGSKDGFNQLRDYFDKNNFTKDQRRMFTKKLKMVANADANTVLIGASTVFNQQQKWSLLDSKSNGISFHTFQEQMKNIDDKALRKQMELINDGLATIPGNFTRFPITASGREGIMTKNILAVQDDIAQFLGMDPEKAHLNSVIGELVKADTDRDMVPIMLQLYDTVDELNDHRLDTKRVISNLMQNTDVQSQVEKYNRNNYILGTYMDRNGTEMAKVQEILPNGKHKQRIVPLHELTEISGMSNLKNVLAKNLRVYDAAQGALKVGSEAMEKHLTTVQLGAFSSSVIGLATNTVRETVHDILSLNKVAGQNIIDMNLIGGSLETGLGGLAQLPIKSVKHGSEEVHRMTEIFSFWKDPSRASTSQFQLAKDSWMDAYDGVYSQAKKMYVPKSGGTYSQKYLDQQSRMMDMIYGTSDMFNFIKSEAPEMMKYMKHAKDERFGRENMDISKLISRTLDEDTASAKFDKQFAVKLNEMFRTKLGSTLDMVDGNFDSNRYFATFTKEMMQDSLDPVSRVAASRLDNMLSSSLVKKSGKFAAIGALAYMGLNFFRPNQLSSSMNPLDEFAQISMTGSDNNAFHSELELDRRVAIDQVNASFSKDAFMFNLDQDKASSKIAESNIISTHLDNTLFKTVSNTKYFNNNVNMNRQDRRTYIGPFGNLNYSRSL